MEKVWFHVDFDAFYASVEQLDNPSYRGKPVIVGGQSNRGVVSTCSYEARAFGVHSAMPMYIAKERCPHAIFVKGRMERYSEVSREVMTLFHRFTPTVQQISIDEAFLDMSGTERLFGKSRQAAMLLKQEVFNKSGLTVSVGIGTSRFIAKMASGYNKPDGLCLVSKGKEQMFVETIGLKKLWGLGESTLAHLAKHNITSVTQLREYEEEHLKRLFGEASGTYLYKVCRGIDPGIHSPVTKSRSLSTETTFSADVSDPYTLEQTLLAMSHEVMFRAFEENLQSSTVAIKIRYSDFSTYTVQTTTTAPLYSAEQVFLLAKELLHSKLQKGAKIRLIGVGLYNVKKTSLYEQQELFDDKYLKKQRLEKTILELKQKGKPLQKASLIDNS